MENALVNTFGSSTFCFGCTLYQGSSGAWAAGSATSTTHASPSRTNPTVRRFMGSSGATVAALQGCATRELFSCLLQLFPGRHSALVRRRQNLDGRLQGRKGSLIPAVKCKVHERRVTFRLDVVRNTLNGVIDRQALIELMRAPIRIGRDVKFTTALGRLCPAQCGLCFIPYPRARLVAF